jgi:hypothetical protein
VALTVIFASILAVSGMVLMVASARPAVAAPKAEVVATHAIDWVALNVWPRSSGVIASVNGPRPVDHRDRGPQSSEREAQWRALLRASNAVTVELPFYVTPAGRHRRQEAA